MDNYEYLKTKLIFITQYYLHYYKKKLHYSHNFTKWFRRLQRLFRNRTVSY